MLAMARAKPVHRDPIECCSFNSSRFLRPATGHSGQFGFADPYLIRKILDSAGFVEVIVEDMREKLPMGGRLALDDAAQWFLRVEFHTILANTTSIQAIIPMVRSRNRASEYREFSAIIVNRVFSSSC